MATSDSTAKVGKKLDADTYKEIVKLVWGEKATDEVFLRWTQGFLFTDGEPSALIQRNGGPCAVIAPVQAYILKNMLFVRQNGSEDTSAVDLSAISDADVQSVLRNSIYDILCNVSQDGNVKLITHLNSTSDPVAGCSSSCDGQSSHKRAKLFSIDSFHEALIYRDYTLDNVQDSLTWYVQDIMGDFGVLSLLYSVILTYGLDKIKSVVEESGEPLVDPTYGHGGQCLVNLLLTGEAAAHVFDGEQDAGGLKLNGISKRSQIGFLSLIEAHHYLEVGWNLKSPLYPIWVLASETHLTVLFSQDKEALAEDKQTEILKIINSYDTEGNGFINSAYLSDLMAALNLLSEPAEYVDIMKNQLDGEGLGIFLISSFMEVFFPKDKSIEEKPQTFNLCHYNGLKSSNNSNKIKYRYADATLRDFLEPTVITDTSPILKCLQTKWPTIELHWQSDVIPSLN